MRWLLFLLGAGLAFGAPSIKVSPASLAFTYQEGSGVMPAAQTLTVAMAATGSGPTTVVVNSAGSQWLTYTPQYGKTNLNVKISVNPTGLPVGQYAESIVLTTPETLGDPLTIPVSLAVKAAPSDLRISPSTASITYRLGDAPPAPVTLSLTTTGGLLSYSATAAGAKWLRINPSGGAVFPGFRSNISLTVDPTDLAPGPQKGTVTISAPDAITKSTTISVNLSVQPGQPVANSMWPPRINVGASDSTVTISGERFFPGTTVKTGNSFLKTTYLGPNAINVFLPSALMAAPGFVPLVVANPDPGGGAAQALNFEVLPPGPLLLAVVNAASQLPSSIAPSMVFTIYGSGLGPDTLTAFDGSTPYLPTALGGTRVYLNGNSLPIIYSSARQLSVAAPNDLAIERPFMLEVEYGPFRSAPLPVLSTGAAPAIFTANGSGTGTAAAFQVDPATGAYSLNGDKTPATKGSILILYATGIAPIQPIPPDGFVAINASPNSLRGLTLLVGDTPADILYAGYAPGLVTGIVQINARLPDTVTTGKAVPLLLNVGSANSQAGVTLNVK